jgi:hypothetical protein
MLLRDNLPTFCHDPRQERAIIIGLNSNFQFLCVEWPDIFESATKTDRWRIPIRALPVFTRAANPWPNWTPFSPRAQSRCLAPDRERAGSRHALSQCADGDAGTV